MGYIHLPNKYDYNHDAQEMDCTPSQKETVHICQCINCTQENVYIVCAAACCPCC